MDKITISLDDISVRYNNGHTALYDVSLQLQGGTTLVPWSASMVVANPPYLKVLMGLIKPQTGHVKLCDLPITQALKKNLVAYVPQSEEVDWQFPVSVLDVVMMGRYGHMNFYADQNQRITKRLMKPCHASKLTILPIDKLANYQAGKKRVFLARALAQESKILLLDEPFTGVDVKTEKPL